VESDRASALKKVERDMAETLGWEVTWLNST